MLQVKESTLYLWANCGLIPASKLNGLWRFDLAEIKEWVANSRPTSAALPTAITGNHRHLDVNKIVKKAIDDVTGKR